MSTERTKSGAGRSSSAKENNNSVNGAAHVTEARLSQLFDPIARLADEQIAASKAATPAAERRQLLAYRDQSGGAHPPPLPPPMVRDSAEYAHLTAYPAIIEPGHYDDGSAR